MVTRHHSAGSEGHRIQAAVFPTHPLNDHIQRAQGASAGVKARIFHHDLAQQRQINRTAFRGAAIGAIGGGAAGGIAAATTSAGVGVAHGALAGAWVGGHLGHAIGSVVGGYRARKADRAMEHREHITSVDHALISVHNAKILTDPMYRAAHSRDYQALMGPQRAGGQHYANGGVGRRMPALAGGHGGGGGIHRDNHGRFA